MKLLAKNRAAFHNYEILDRFEAGLVLTGGEIKAIRAGKMRLDGSFARFLGARADQEPELFVVNLHLGVTDGDSTRSRKLLMHRGEIDRLRGQIEAKGLTLVPLALGLSRGRAKLELGLGRGLKQHDKRERLRRRAVDRDIDQALRGKA
jgi:SsrA-binding protein